MNQTTTTDSSATLAQIARHTEEARQALWEAAAGVRAAREALGDTGDPEAIQLLHLVERATKAATVEADAAFELADGVRPGRAAAVPSV